MIAGLGIDLVELERVARLHKKYGARFLDKFLTTYERDAAAPSPSYLASRFAAKEAAVKALGTGFARGICPRQIEVHIQAGGLPGLRLYGNAEKHAQALGITHYYLSLTHERRMACAVVIMEK